MTSSGRRPRITRPATMRDHAIDERPATPLELLFDLCFVVSVAALAAELDHGIVDGHALDAGITYALLFVPIWWAWMSYTWFATAFSHDDAVTRLLTLLQMGGVLVVAAALPGAWEGDLVPFSLAYAAMRLPLIVQWLRSALADPDHRSFALTYAVGAVAAQALWIGGALLPSTVGTAVVFALALAVELGTPVLAVSRSSDAVFHPGHIAERYGLFTLIVLGETILAVSVGLRETIASLADWGTAPAIVAAALVIAFGLWWIYFDALKRDALTRNRKAAFLWGYGHYALFAAIAAAGAGVQAQLHLAHDDHGSTLVPVVALALPVAISLAAIAWLQQAANGLLGDAAWPYLGALAVLLVVPIAPWVGVAGADALVALVVVALVARELIPRPAV